MSPSPPEYQPERRPIASREKELSKRIASWLVRRQVSPNAISLAGMTAGIAAGAAFSLTAMTGWTRAGFLLAAVLMQARLIANMLDGMVALEAGAMSPVGELYNEVPDRVADAAMFMGAGYALSSSPELGYLAACLAIFVAYVRAEGKVAGAPQEYSGPLAKPQRVFVMSVAAIVCAVVPVDVHARLEGVRLAGLPGGILAWTLWVCLAGMVITAARRLNRIAGHLRGRAT